MPEKTINKSFLNLIYITVLSASFIFSALNAKGQPELDQVSETHHNSDEEQLTRLKAENRTKAIVVFSLSGLIILILAIHRNQTRKLKRKNEQLAGIKKVDEMSKDRMEERIRFNSELIQFLAARTIAKNQLIKEMISKLDILEQEGASNLPKTLANIKADIYSRFEGEAELKELEVYLDKKGQDFTYKLVSKFENLTKGEIRLATYLRLNLSLKQIALLSNVTTKTVEMGRYRLRKKLELKTEDNLEEFLSGI